MNACEIYEIFKEHFNRTSLYIAVEKNRLDIVQILLSRPEIKVNMNLI